jgi:hypothetical protein
MSNCNSALVNRDSVTRFFVNYRHRRTLATPVIDRQRQIIANVTVNNVDLGARIYKNLWRPGIDSDESITPGWESIPGFVK